MFQPQAKVEEALAKVESCTVKTAEDEVDGESPVAVESQTLNAAALLSKPSPERIGSSNSEGKLPSDYTPALY